MDKVFDLIRVFPRRTTYTPEGPGVFFDAPPLWVQDVQVPVHVSVTFTWDLARAEFLAKQWERVSNNIQMGGPALDAPAGPFVPGRYVRHGITVTSRGCPRSCSFCLVPRREGRLQELEIHPGNHVIDNNLLACSRTHVEAVFSMLRGQKDIQLVGGIDARLLRPWHVEAFRGLRMGQIFLAYDHPDSLDSVQKAAQMLSVFPAKRVRCYVLIGQPGDTLDAAEGRLVEAFEAGTLPFAMLYRENTSAKRTVDRDWSALVKTWTRPAMSKAFMKQRGLS